MSTTATTHTKALPVLYVAGPMSGLPEFNYPAFNHAAHQLRQAGYPVINPAEDGLPVESPWALHVRLGLTKLMRCDAVAVLPGAENSRGAQLEIATAQALGMRVCPLDAWLF